MRDAYTQLLEATIQHLETLKARGLQFVTVSTQTLQALQAEPAITNRRSAAGFRGEAVRSSPGRRTAQTEVSPAQKSGVKAGTELSLTQERTQPIAKEDQRTPLSAEAKTAAFAELRQRVMPCTKCAHLASSRKNVVFGVGDINARLLFVGEAPGADEDEQAEPFVGKAGQLLTRIIQTMGLSRSSVYIANILKCRPDTPGQASGNRKPTAEEMQTCIPFLHEQIDLIAPKVIVALGATAVEGLLGKTIGITRLRGQWRMYRGVPLMPTYHPAYLLRNQALSEKRRVWEDMLQVMERLELPISEKQRNFFLK